MTPTVIRDVRVVTPDHEEPTPADVTVAQGRIEAITAPGQQGDAEADTLDGGGRLLLPGFIDAHSHTDAVIFDEQVQLDLLRQGVTTVICGQDGVSFAPGDGSYGTEYFAGINGSHPHYRGGGVAELLASYDHATRINVGYLVPLGTVRYEVMGRDNSPATPQQIAVMQALVTTGLDEGALGVSSGLDYVPGVFADATELAQMCVPVAAADAVYVTHMRGGYEANAAVGVAEVVEIAKETGVRAHISHYHGAADLLTTLVDDAHSGGVELSYDTYYYRRGCSLMAMPLLPHDLLARPGREVAVLLREPETRAMLLGTWFPSHEQSSVHGPDWPDLLTLASVPSAAWEWAAGMTVREAATRVQRSPREVALDILADTDLATTVVMAVRETRSHDEMVPLFTHAAHCGGSDGITLGTHPHPRAYGAFPRYLRELVRDRDAWTWAEAAWHLSEQTANVHGLSGRGVIRPGAVADLILVDPDTVTDRATYPNPRALSIGIDDVLVAGVPVLRGGQLTEHRPGRGLRRGQH